ncbi:hypothetical protein GCM10025768_06840 [Microbacterium pseudoresistens]|uniref:LPXTG cell wall anchor domain-containing protein n=1 Tax=Microbacterium pseudoresistens TaxID=640634 RepID=A0A7Y9EVD0_9MICO|nr:S1 family peptidase [Microbacterium pseudoresistens]NYD54521.1 hypothetical protein [Microbacterium pseudoresistens]
MKKSFRRAGQVAAVGVAAALAGGGLIVTPAFASDVQTETAPVLGDQYDAFATSLLTEHADVVNGVGFNGSDIVVSVTDDEKAAAAKELLAEYSNIVIKNRGYVQAQTTDDVVGGAGLINENASAVCSFGFSGWSPSGDPIILSAGHCGEVGDVVTRSLPSDDDAPYFPGEEPTYTVTRFGDVGSFEFSQWGGPGGSAGSAGDLTSTDISAISVDNSALNLLPKVTDWSSWESEDLSTSGTAITSVGTVAVGDSIFRSGRSTGKQEGSVTEIQSYVNVCEDVTTDPPTNCHVVYGFWTDAVSRGGDSGGSFVKGNAAVGVLSGGNGTESFATDLSNALVQADGYTVMLDLAEPAVTSPASGSTVAPGATISGTGPAGLTLTGFGSDIVIGDDGNWTATAPSEPGTHDFTLQVKDAGYNKSDTVPYSIKVEAAAIASPVITSPAEGSEVTGPQVTISGTGAAGATIELTGDVTGTTTVADGGTWSIIGDAEYGAAEVTATQTLGADVQTTNVSFTVVQAALAAPVITSPANGAELTTSPSAITGTGVAGAEVEVSLGNGSSGDTLPPVTVDAEGNWAVEVSNQLAEGTYTIGASQSLNGETSAVVSSTFTIVAATTPTPTPTDDPNGQLPGTGADGGALLGTGIVGGALVLIAGSVLLIARMRRNAAAE